MTAHKAGLVIIGARLEGQLPVVYEVIAESTDYEVVALVDDDNSLWGHSVMGLPVIGGVQVLPEYALSSGISAAFVAIGDMLVRARIAARCQELGLSAPTFVHPTAFVSAQARIGKGCFIGAGAQVLTGSEVGDLARINAGAVISHAVRLGFANTVGPNATLTGRVTTGAQVLIGAGSTILNDVKIGAGAIVGAGAVVTRDVLEGQTVVGIPARPLK